MRKVWEVDIDILGPISISRNINFKQEKGFSEDQFYSDVKLSPNQMGVCSTVTAYADNCDIAKTVAYVFFGRMVDVLALDNDIPLILLEHDSIANHFSNATTRRHLDKEDFITAFNVARRLEIEHPILLKSIGWYSKGKNSNNTLDRFLAYWNAIEIAATGYHTETERTQSGAINMVYQCFLDHFGPADSWGISDRWINDMHFRRSRIAHGAEETTVEAINIVAEQIPSLEFISRKLIYAVLSKNYQRDIFEQESFKAGF